MVDEGVGAEGAKDGRNIVHEDESELAGLEVGRGEEGLEMKKIINFYFFVSKNLQNPSITLKI